MRALQPRSSSTQQARIETNNGLRKVLASQKSEKRKSSSSKAGIKSQAAASSASSSSDKNADKSLVKSKIPSSAALAHLRKHGLAANSPDSGYKFKFKDSAKTVTSKIFSILPALATYLIRKYLWLKNLRNEDHAQTHKLPFVLLSSANRALFIYSSSEFDGQQIWDASKKNRQRLEKLDAIYYIGPGQQHKCGEQRVHPQEKIAHAERQGSSSKKDKQRAAKRKATVFSEPEVDSDNEHVKIITKDKRKGRARDSSESPSEHAAKRQRPLFYQLNAGSDSLEYEEQDTLTDKEIEAGLFPTHKPASSVQDATNDVHFRLSPEVETQAASNAEAPEQLGTAMPPGAEDFGDVAPEQDDDHADVIDLTKEAPAITGLTDVTGEADKARTPPPQQDLPPVKSPDSLMVQIDPYNRPTGYTFMYFNP
ncbi:uncharacterized protein PHACADRAFT_33077 [Phanerochaete carnosa HHB-10118-sp]|uniref:Uncharacterized protein n=1 Tax=Phanerochaete carnosa (strain HHB-10118-sp) TaxID=650164 RepID=K5VGM2_PHACS|nr:uncharacterized protein PHACADRAFT_33077 [Phanerochaete carnosa HHB-10118-sp]EKM50338.1 hypothetical protein PHACADRAFT_33077 [Phanerochaete carnosa HHB-10118-sp]